LALDNFRKINITLNKVNQHILEPQIAKVGDVNGRELVVQLIDGGVIKDQTGVSLKLNWQHANGNQGAETFSPLDAKQGLFSVYYPENMLFRGTVTANISINENGKITNSLNFQIAVKGDVFNGSAVEVDGILFTLKDLKNQLDERDDNLATLENRQTSVESQFNSLQQELTNKDPISAPEIIAARNGEATLKDRLDKEQQEVNSQLAQIAISITNPPTSLTPAIGDGLTNDTSAIQAILDYASTVNGIVLVPANHTFLVTELTIKDGVKGFKGDGVIKGRGESVNGLVKLGTSQQKLKNATISIVVDMSGGDVFGIYGYVEGCNITNNKVYNFVDGTSQKYGILLQEGSKNNTLSKNTVTGTHKPSGGYQFMIILLSGVTEVWGGYYDGEGGVPVRAINAARENVISENILVGGTHGIVVNGGIANVITNNVCKYNSHRGIILEPSCFDNIVNNNQLHAYGSAGVLLGYGCCDNLIANNQFTDDLSVFPPDGEGAIALYIGCNDNKVIGNKIKSQRRYGVYLAVDVQSNVVENNSIEGYRRAGVAIESDWIPVGSTFEAVTLPTNAKYSRPNYDGRPRYNTAGTQLNKWGYKTTKGNIIQHNTIKRGSAESTAVYLAQIGENLKLEENTVQNNVIDEALTNFFYLYMYEDKVNMLGKNSLKNNNFIGGASITPVKFYFESRFFIERLGNTYIDTGNFDLPLNQPQPSVKVGEVFRLVNTVATDITNFTDAYEGQTITIRLDGFSTIKHSSANLRLKNNVDVLPTNSNSFITLKRIAGIWFEMFRNF